MDKKEILLFVPKRGKNRNRFYEIFSGENEIPLKKIKNAVGRSTYHDYLKNEIAELNQSLEEMNEKINTFENSTIEKNGKELKTVKKNPNMRIIPTTHHYVLRFENENQNGNQN